MNDLLDSLFTGEEIQIDMTVNWLTWVLLGIATLILAGRIVSRWRERRQYKRQLREQWLAFKEWRSDLEIVKKKKPECQYGGSFHAPWQE